MRISDWSSDVCSSDLPDARVLIAAVIDDPAGVDAGKRGRLEFDEIAGAHRDGEAAGTDIGPVMRADVDARRLGFRHIHIAGVDALGIAARVSRDAVATLVVARGPVHAPVEPVLAAARRAPLAGIDTSKIAGAVQPRKATGLQ